MTPSNEQNVVSDSDSDHDHHITLPLLLRPSYPRSKSIISDELRNFRISLKWCALDHSSITGKFLSYFTFITLTIIVPIITTLTVIAPVDDPISFNKLVQLPESGLTLISFFTLSRFFRRYGLRQLLFLDELHDDSLYVQRHYAIQLEKSFRFLSFILFPSFFVEIAHKIIFFTTVKFGSGDIAVNSIVFVLVMVAWVYRNGVFLLVCVLFRLTCELQILRLQGLQKLFEGSGGGSGADAVAIFGEHLRIRKQLSVTSHRYRFFIIGSLIVISVSQLGALMLVLASKLEKNFFNSGDIVVCSVVQLCGFLLCLFGAARITHRVQGIISLATRWNMLVTSASAGHDPTKALAPLPVANTEHGGDEDGIGDEGDSDSSDVFISVRSQEPSFFQTRQALVAYLQHNNRGITLYGFALDRGLLHTLFAFEFSLVLWILSKAVVLS